MYGGSISHSIFVKMSFPTKKSFDEKGLSEVEIVLSVTWIRVSGVDMCLGVRDETTDDHMASELCLRELIACPHLSTG